ncbi:hypothetical protein EDB92DRAFT_1812698 [Lactarius akahatsu]|uniref:Uncharacterized protein n=1 Tax=Lactarius akahatsu TaxID=416441 RepID=A0AAD4LPN8_9AGAM|nr:hypothetical protein EDB92DRAFT_1812698 [Lactarius akahatsu]
MYKLARIARIIVNVCERYNLSEEELPASLRDILGSLQRTRELDRIERVLKKCSKRKDLKGILLRKDLLTKIKQCDVELSNVLQAFQAELGLDIRFALIPQKSNAAQIFWGIKSTLGALWRARLNVEEPVIRPGHSGTPSDKSNVIQRSTQPKITRSMLYYSITFFFLKNPLFPDWERETSSQRDGLCSFGP